VSAGVLADLVVVVHFAFLLFVVLGGLLLLRWPRVALAHVPAAVWGVLIEFGSWICPLTPLENHFRALAGEAGYSGGFIQHYVTAVLYPDGLTRGQQVGLGLFALAVNVAVYTWVILRRARRRRAHDGAPPGATGGGR
jgi:hypothetical protein